MEAPVPVLLAVDEDAPSLSVIERELTDRYARSYRVGMPAYLVRAQRGFVLTGADVESDGNWSCERSPLALETSMPGVFAAGDVRQGSMTRVASAVGEGAIAIKLIDELFAADRQHDGDRL